MPGKNKNDVTKQYVGTNAGLVSVVIPTKDSGRTLRKCLESLMSTDLPEF